MNSCERMKRKSRWKLPPFRIRKALLVNSGRKRGRDRYRFELASVMAWLIQLPAARIASAISKAAKIVMAVGLMAVVCPCSCFACSRSWFSVGIEENLVTEERKVEPQRTLLCSVIVADGIEHSSTLPASRNQPYIPPPPSTRYQLPTCLRSSL
jgi:hypothetical protein